MMILCLRLGLEAGYLDLKLNKPLSKLDLTYKTKETKKVKNQFQVSVCLIV